MNEQKKNYRCNFKHFVYISLATRVSTAHTYEQQWEVVEEKKKCIFPANSTKIKRHIQQQWGEYRVPKWTRTERTQRALCQWCDSDKYICVTAQAGSLSPSANCTARTLASIKANAKHSYADTVSDQFWPFERTIFCFSLVCASYSLSFLVFVSLSLNGRSMCLHCLCGEYST